MNVKSMLINAAFTIAVIVVAKKVLPTQVAQLGL